MIIKTKFNKYWFLFYVSKVFWMFFAVLIFANLTPLGDSGAYFNGSINVWQEALTNSTKMMVFIGGMLGEIFFRTYITHLFFLSLTVYGLYYAISKMYLNNKELIVLLLFLSIPSFGIWTSIIGKEAVGCFAMCIFAGYFIDMIQIRRIRPVFIEIIATYLIFMFKPQYLIALVHVWIILLIKIKFKKNPKLIFFTALFLFSIDILIFYQFREEINILSFGMYVHFSFEGASTRANLWVNDYDVFWNAPYGMFIAFFGPTVAEVIGRPINILVFLESLVVVTFIGYFFLRVLLTSLKTKRINVLLLSILFFIYFWLLLVHYPFGALNPGSALRYRENFYGFLVIMSYFFYIKNFRKSNEIQNG